MFFIGVCLFVYKIAGLRKMITLKNNEGTRLPVKRVESAFPLSLRPCFVIIIINKKLSWCWQTRTMVPFDMLGMVSY